MKFSLILIPVVAVFIGCSTSKTATEGTNSNPVSEQTETQENDQEVDDQNTNQQMGLSMSEGIVRDKSADGCGFVIEILVDNVNNRSSFLQPLSLPEKFQVDGAPIRFTYRMSRRASKCTFADPIIIDKITE